MELTPGTTLTVRTRGGRVCQMDVPRRDSHQYAHMQYALAHGDIAIISLGDDLTGADEPSDVPSGDDGEDESADDQPEHASSDDGEGDVVTELRATYERRAGVAPHPRWKEARLRSELAKLDEA